MRIVYSLLMCAVFGGMSACAHAPKQQSITFPNQIAKYPEQVTVTEICFYGVDPAVSPNHAGQACDHISRYRSGYFDLNGDNWTDLLMIHWTKVDGVELPELVIYWGPLTTSEINFEKPERSIIRYVKNFQVGQLDSGPMELVLIGHPQGVHVVFDGQFRQNMPVSYTNNYAQLNGAYTYDAIDVNIRDVNADGNPDVVVNDSYMAGPAFQKWAPVKDGVEVTPVPGYNRQGNRTIEKWESESGIGR